MPSKKTADRGLMTRRARHGWAAVSIFAALALIAAAMVIPFRFESMSMYYKFGADKLMLRTGKVIGLIAAMLLLYQLLLAGRLQVLDRIFSLPALYRGHRIAAYAVVVLVLAHPVLVLVADDMYMIPFQARYWPEWVGAGLLVLILCQVVFSRWRRAFSIRYHRWLVVHRLAAIALVAALAVHILYVSETFEHGGVPHGAVFVVAGGWALLWAWIRWQSSGPGRRQYTVAAVADAGQDAHSVDLVPEEARSFAYAPGQFVFVSFRSSRISTEAHPFTLSSAPNGSGALQITVRRCGDFTDRIGALEKGDIAKVQGPFGHFTHLLEPPGREIVMIAGGIGITPMLSMLRYMCHTDDPRPVTLIWSNRSEGRFFSRRELEKMQEKLTHFKWIPIFSRKQAGFGHFGRLDPGLLEDVLTDTPRTAAVYVCGPTEMIRQVCTALRQLGFGARSIRQETFGL